MKMLIIDGVKYRLWTPKDEEKDFHPMVKKHSKEIFGEDSIYFDIKHKLTSKSGIAAIPDAYVITLSKPYEWYIVENELASHPVYSHIVPQVSRFVDSIEELETQRDIRDILNNEIEHDMVLKAYIEKKIGKDPYRFLSELLSSSPKIALIIDEVTPEVDKASKSLKKLANTEIIEFKTFVREDAPNVHAHLFEPLYEEAHAEYGEDQKGFFCLIGDEKHKSILYNVVEIIEHLRDEHHIHPNDQIIDGWTPKFQRQWKKHEEAAIITTPQLTKIESKVLQFLETLDHPATSNEIRDKFGFRGRDPARRLMKKLAKLGYGECLKERNRYRFYLKGKF